MAKSTSGGCIRALEDKPRGKCRKWKLTISLGRDPATGKYAQKNRNFTGTYTEAQKELRRFQGEAEEGLLVNAKHPKYTLEAYAKLYIDESEAAGVFAQNTANRCRSRIRSIAPLIGKARLGDVTPEMLSKAYADLRNGKSLSGKKLSGTYVAAINTTLEGMFTYAIKQGVATENPCKSATVPQNDTKERRALEEGQMERLLASLDPANARECAVYLCATLGLRRAEACSLSWGDVDLVDKVLHVGHSMNDDGTLKDPKTLTSDRELPIPQAVEAALRKRRAAQAEALAFEAPGLLAIDKEGVLSPKPEVPVVSYGDGRRLRASTFGSWWGKHRADYGAEGVTLHELRHSFITLAASKNVHPSVIQKLAGHSDPYIAMQVYTHVKMQEKRAALDALDAVYEMGAAAAESPENAQGGDAA